MKKSMQRGKHFLKFKIKIINQINIIIIIFLENLLDKYCDGNRLTDDEFKFMANTSELLN